ncbi:START-like domain-containing protein [Arcticibacterium luteifluviistationis]|uniref:ATPase n=1 Tax=Arcticibacterium luteifluviistationis TaxID=1784714 RepID=A0A2Z4G724_9BACT|nr:START-like domain-containing protein [Arcticibacterium luteifluviistationis]AWV96883.1 ATPase [Arcticibacterium luteifluviistationis]
MSKHKFVGEFSFKTSPKVIYNYISTPGGLQQWFATQVSVDSNHNFIIEWDGGKHLAEVTKKVNKSARFDFQGEDEGNSLELKLVLGELDGSTYLEVTDVSDNDDDDELQDLWDGLIADLKDIVGG